MVRDITLRIAHENWTFKMNYLFPEIKVFFVNPERYFSDHVRRTTSIPGFSFNHVTRYLLAINRKILVLYIRWCKQRIQTA